MQCVHRRIYTGIFCSTVCIALFALAKKEQSNGNNLDIYGEGLVK